jgi:hypothetical protein
MRIGDMFPAPKRSGSARVSDLDRQRAAERAKQLAAEGFIRGDEELRLRLRKIQLALNRRELEVALDGLDAGADRLKGGELRASDADRRDALRRLDMHESLGHLSADEASARGDLVAASKTPADIARVFFDLPALPADSKSAERRISGSDREAALALLRQARAEERIDDAELAGSEAQVRSARTRSELNAAFRGLSTPARAAAAKTASDVTRRGASVTRRVVAEGGRRAKRAFMRAVFASAALMLGVVLLIAGLGAVALICFVAAVVLYAAAAASLVVSRSSA